MNYYARAEGISLENDVERTTNNFTWILFLSLFVTGFMGIGVYLPLLLIPYIGYYILTNKFDRRFWSFLILMFFFGLSYSVISFLHGYASPGIVLMYISYPILLFALGYKLTSIKSYKKTYQLIMVIVVSMAFFGFLSVMKTIKLYGSMDAVISSLGGRLVLNIWTNDPLSATVMNMRLSFGAALLPIVFLLRDKDAKHFKLIKVISLISFVISVYAIMQLGNRTGLVIIAASFIMVFLFSQKINFKKMLNSIYIIFLFGILAILYNLNVFGIKNNWESSTVFYRMQIMDGTDDPRILAWKSTLTGLFNNPIGGKETEMNLSYAHNLWLDVGYETGIMPFILLTTITIMAIMSFISFLKKDFPIFMKGLIIALLTATFISFTLEPVIQAWFSYFNIFCFITGMVYKMNFENRRAKHLSHIVDEMKIK